MSAAAIISDSDIDSSVLVHSHVLEIPYFPTVSKACSELSIDAAVISTPTPSHAAIICEAAENNLHIFIEKPVAETVDEMQELFTLAAAKNIHLCCGFQRRFDPSYKAAMEANIGEAVTARLFFGDHPAPPASFMNAGGSDIFTDLAAHDVDFISHTWADQNVVSVYAKKGPHESATLVLEFERG